MEIHESQWIGFKLIVRGASDCVDICMSNVLVWLIRGLMWMQLSFRASWDWVFCFCAVENEGMLKRKRKWQSWKDGSFLLACRLWISILPLLKPHLSRSHLFILSFDSFLSDQPLVHSDPGSKQAKLYGPQFVKTSKNSICTNARTKEAYGQGI